MNRLKLLYILLTCTVLLSVIFGILILLQYLEGNHTGGIGTWGTWSGVISQLLLSVALIIEIVNIKRGKNH